MEGRRFFFVAYLLSSFFCIFTKQGSWNWWSPLKWCWNPSKSTNLLVASAKKVQVAGVFPRNVHLGYALPPISRKGSLAPFTSSKRQKHSPCSLVNWAKTSYAGIITNLNLNHEIRIPISNNQYEYTTWKDLVFFVAQLDFQAVFLFLGSLSNFGSACNFCSNAEGPRDPCGTGFVSRES